MTSGATELEPAAALLRRRSYAAAERALAALPAHLRKAPGWQLLQGATLMRLGRIAAAQALLEPLTRGPEPWAAEATAALADLLHLDAQPEALRALLERTPAWAQTPRGRLFEARLLLRADPAQALALLLNIADAPGPAPAELRRIAGFDAVKLLDRLGRYREAHALATRLHARAPPFDLAQFLAGLRLQQRLLAKGPAWCPPRAAPVGDTAFIVGLPRSGTTLLEQMLDAHPGIAGIGEHEGMAELVTALVGAGAWPYRMAYLPADKAAALQQHYRETARQRAARPAPWTVDKSLLSWQWLPAVAAVLPGAPVLHMLRDPRDMALSAFLSPLDAQAFGWVAELDRLRQVIELERTLVPQALQTLGIAHETVVYEDLVAAPARAMAPLLARLGLPTDERVLAPERNTRLAFTLSHEQVRRPINDASIGRWQHYDFAFDARWDALAAAHAARRATPA